MTFSHETGRSIEIDGAEIYYEEAGSNDAPPLLLLHGGVGSIEDFNCLLPSLASQYRVIGIDSRGHGRSTLGNTTLSYQRLEQDVTEVLRHLRINRTAVLGFSDGGIVGYRLMLSGEVSVTRLITIGAPCELNEDSPLCGIYASVTGESWRAKFPASHELYQQLNPEPDFDHFMKALVAMWLDSDGYPGKMVENIKGNVLIVRGDEDRLFSRQEAFELAQRIKLSVLENIAFAGHAAHEDRPDVLLSSIHKFLITREGV